MDQLLSCGEVAASLEGQSSVCLHVCVSVCNCFVCLLVRLSVCVSLLTKSYLQASWHKVCAMAVTLGIPTPYFSTALTFYDGYRSGSLTS